jgi:hypothetical protein
MLNKALVVSHELSRPAEMDDYLARVLNPVNPLIIWGRSKDADPPCKAEHCMWYLWKDEWKAPRFSATCVILHMFVDPKKCAFLRVFVCPCALSCTVQTVAPLFAHTVWPDFNQPYSMAMSPSWSS